MQKLKTGIIVVLISVGIGFIDQCQMIQWKQKNRLLLQSTVDLCRMRLENTIGTRFDAIESLAALFTLHIDTTPEEFAHFAKSILMYNPPIRALQYANPETLVTYVYPQKKNEITIQKPMLLLSDSKRGPYVKRAIEQKSVVMQGPFNLRQGGMGVVVRLPIFKANTFLGLAIGVYDMNQLIDEALTGMPLEQFVIQIKQREGNIFYGDVHLPKGACCESLSILSSNWTLCIARAPYTLTPPITTRVLIWGSGLILILSLFLLTRKIKIHSNELQQMIDERTESLITLNSDLKHEIAERKMAEISLKESELKFKTVANFTYDWEYWMDPDGKFIYISPSCKRISGYETDDFYHHPQLLRELVHPDDLVSFNKHIEMDEHIPSHECIFRIFTREGHVRWISQACQTVYDDNGNYLGKRASNRDITNYRKLQQQRIKSHKLEMIGRLAGGVAHQYNNALSVILGYIDLMTFDQPNTVNQKVNEPSYLTDIKSAAQKMQRLTSQLLAYARGGKYLTTSLSLKSFIQDTIPIITHSFKEIVSVTVNCPENFCQIEADPTQLQMVFSSILINAFEAIDGKGEIDVSCQPQIIPEEGRIVNDVEIPTGTYACITVMDSGKGMDHKTKERIFEPFYSTKFEGRGLGMAAAYGIIKNHGGFITVASQRGQGTTVVIYLPVISYHSAKCKTGDEAYIR